jgi:hypothetical protein
MNVTFGLCGIWQEMGPFVKMSQTEGEEITAEGKIVRAIAER